MLQPRAVRVRMAWWLRPWLIGVYVVAALSGRQPDEDRVARMMARAVRIRVG